MTDALTDAATAGAAEGKTGEQPDPAAPAPTAPAGTLVPDTEARRVWWFGARGAQLRIDAESDVARRAGASRLDLAILEVGLGGRLDAVNIIDADCAVITSIDLDHMEFLGPDRESIGYEKAGILRTGRPALDNFPMGLAVWGLYFGGQTLIAALKQRLADAD